MWSHVYASIDLQIEHVIERDSSLSKNSFFLALPIYWPVQNLNIFVFCAYVIDGLDQNELDNLVLIFGFIDHLLMLGSSIDIISRLFSKSYLVMYIWRHLTWPLSGRVIDLGHLSF